jgi:hypothetical protein
MQNHLYFNHRAFNAVFSIPPWVNTFGNENSNFVQFFANFQQQMIMKPVRLDPRLASGNSCGPIALLNAKRRKAYFSQTSTRRFFSRPSSVSLEATGTAEPKLVHTAASTPRLLNWRGSVGLWPEIVD